MISSPEDAIMRALRLDRFGDPAVLPVTQLPKGTALSRPGARTMA
jgi:hypothetical protein